MNFLFLKRKLPSFELSAHGVGVLFCPVGICALEGLLYVCGGYDGASCLNSMERFDPLTGVWTSCPAMLLRRRYCRLAVLGESAAAAAAAVRLVGRHARRTASPVALGGPRHGGPSLRPSAETYSEMPTDVLKIVNLWLSNFSSYQPLVFGAVRKCLVESMLIRPPLLPAPGHRSRLD